MKHDYKWVKFDTKHNVNCEILDGLEAEVKHDLNKHSITIKIEFKPEDYLEAYALFTAFEGNSW
jgi:hypothetical protein